MTLPTIPAATSANNIVKWNTLTNIWSALGADSGLTGNGVDSDVSAIAINGGDIYVGGYFTTAYNNNGSSVAANRAAKWNGTAWSALGTPAGNGLDNYVTAIAVTGGSVYVGGVFTTANNGGSAVTANHIARWNGSTWSALAGGLNGGVQAIAVFE